MLNRLGPQYPAIVFPAGFKNIDRKVALSIHDTWLHWDRRWRLEEKHTNLVFISDIMVTMFGAKRFFPHWVSVEFCLVWSLLLQLLTGDFPMIEYKRLQNRQALVPWLPRDRMSLASASSVSCRNDAQHAAFSFGACLSDIFPRLPWSCWFRRSLHRWHRRNDLPCYQPQRLRLRLLP